MFESHRDQLLGSLDAAHDAYYRAAVFGGPSLYFHRQTLLAASQGDFDRFAELAYALLTAWGMHRMGKGGSKMRDFEEFEASLRPLWPVILRLQKASPETLDESGWEDLASVFRSIRCMATGTSLVGNSKVMAHALPNLIPPVDREYTIQYLRGNKNIVNGIDTEWRLFEGILRDFFYPVVTSQTFEQKAGIWMSNQVEFRWDTSPLKVVDNLVIGLLRTRRNEKAAQKVAGLAGGGSGA